MILKFIFKFLILHQLYKICLACNIGNEMCTCLYLNSTIEMECDQKNENLRIIDLAEINHDFNFQVELILKIRNQNKIKIISTKNNVSSSIIELSIIQNDIDEIYQNVFDDMYNLKILDLNSSKIKKIKN